MKFSIFIALVAVLTVSVAHAQTPPVCPFKPDELTKVFGIPFAAGRVDSEHALGASQYRECIYDGGPFAVRVGTVVMGADWATVGRFRDPPRTKHTPIVNDPDKAWIVTGPVDSHPAHHLLPAQGDRGGTEGRRWRIRPGQPRRSHT